jgi:hypothetical protein
MVGRRPMVRELAVEDWNGRGAVFMFYTPIALAFMIMLYET